MKKTVTLKDIFDFVTGKALEERRFTSVKEMA
jgi:hypothetical protein